MTKRIIILGGLLVLQIAVAVGLNVSKQDYRTFELEENLLSFDAEAVDRIRIDGDADTHVILHKQDNQWRLPGLHDFPADQGNVKHLIERLAQLKKGWPVATTPGAAKRFKVAETSFERKLTLSQSEEALATLYVGTSPGFRKVHVRLPVEDDVYAVEFNTYEVGVKPEDWIDKAILTHPADDIQRVELPGFTLQQQDDKLEVVGLAEDEETIKDEAKRLLDHIAELNIRAVLDPDSASDHPQDTPELRYTLALKSGETQTYAFSKPQDKDADYYVLTASPRDESFQVDTWSVDQIKGATRDKLVRKKTKEPEAPQETPKATDAKPDGTGG
jgi:hypothetical protein